MWKKIDIYSYDTVLLVIPFKTDIKINMIFSFYLKFNLYLDRPEEAIILESEFGRGTICFITLVFLING